MPKGGALHLHDGAIVSSDWVINNLTYWDNLFFCEDNERSQFAWLNNIDDDLSCNWTSLKTMREDQSDEIVNKHLRHVLTLEIDSPEDLYSDINTVWSKFQSIFGTLHGLLSYQPAYEAFLRQTLLEFMEDNVQFLEFRTWVPFWLCKDLGRCTEHVGQKVEAERMIQIIQEFTAEHKDEFCGATMIVASLRSFPLSEIKKQLDFLLEIRQHHADYFTGFDLVGQEDLGRPLLDFADMLMAAKETDPNLKFFLHAGETNWQGQSTDENILDAILLNTTRLGHGYTIVKHPEALKMLLEKDIPIEVCPISNQVLGLVNDLRNHPVSQLIQQNVPITLSSDDPLMWNAKGISYDFYETFMAMTGAPVDLRFLKRLALDSIKYAETPEKERCYDIFERKWNKFLSEIASKSQLKNSPDPVLNVASD